ncbi:P-type conjugative transfer protein TrbJ [Mesorhizobium sp. AR02]|uniref:P-type conjugative transfer protein TrbJ n=1 Tax=Mesorhizobium sp. AR02 TaxID=2865837 RepID=UPI002202E01E|nr:P-type conjugative transfer protein TrbJ [Mesorhizobium sp. AR02]
MTYTLFPLRAGLLASAMLAAPVVMSAFLATPARALIVFDPSNYAENVLQAARALQQINNQIQSLTNQAQMLVNQARNLASLPMSTLAQLQSSVQQTQQLLGQAQNIAFNVQQIQTAFASTYGKAPTSSSNASLIADAQTRWQNSVGAFQDSLKVQAGVVGNIPSNSSAMTSLVSASQSATGALQAAQAGNQLLALQSQQLSDLVAVLAAKGRADALEQARVTATEAQGQQQYKIFSTRSGYQPVNVTMFSGN